MTDQRIEQLADFFYSSNSSNDVPLRLTITMGQYNGFDLNKEAFIDLMYILNNSKDLKNDLMGYLDNFNNDYEQES